MSRPFTHLQAARATLSGARHAIDRVDTAMIALLGARRRLVGVASAMKHTLHAPLRDPKREQQVHARARSTARRWHVPIASAEALTALLIDDACRQQARSARLRIPGDADPMANMHNRPASDVAPRWWLRLLPPPSRLRAPIALVPQRWQAVLLRRVLSRALASPMRGPLLASVEGRRIGIDVDDLGLRWVLELRDGRLRVSDAPAEATVRGNAADLLLLASRQQDADTLFFQRRLTLLGDTELGLTVRNLLDRVPWESIPLGLRIALHRFVRLTEAARAAHADRH